MRLGLSLTFRKGLHSKNLRIPPKMNLLEPLNLPSKTRVLRCYTCAWTLFTAAAIKKSLY